MRTRTLTGRFNETEIDEVLRYCELFKITQSDFLRLAVRLTLSGLVSTEQTASKTLCRPRNSIKTKGSEGQTSSENCPNMSEEVPK